MHTLYQHYHEDFDVHIRISADAREHSRKTMKPDEDHLSARADKDWQQVSQAVIDKMETK